MSAIEFVSRLYDVDTTADGEISAFDSYGNYLHIGTDRGYLIRLSVEGLPRGGQAAPSPSPVAASFCPCEGENAPANPAVMPPLSAPASAAAVAAAPIASRVEQRVRVAGTHTTAISPVVQLQHSRAQPLLFVLCEGHLFLYRADTYDLLGDLLSNVTTFDVLYQPSARPLSSTQSPADSRRWAMTPPSPAESSSVAGGVHVLSVVERWRTELSIYQVDGVSTQAGCPPQVILLQRLLLPEPALSVSMGAVSSDTNAEREREADAAMAVCVGMPRECSMIPLNGGTPWSILRLDSTRPPLLAVGNDAFFVQTQARNTVMEVGLPGATRDGLSATPLRVGRPRFGDVYQAAAEVLLIRCRFPYLFLFTATHCEAFSLITGELCETVPLPAVQYGAFRGQGAALYVAGKETVWLLHLSALRHQLAALVEGGFVAEAFELLKLHQRRAMLKLTTLEKELHVMAGFAYLHQGRCAEALAIFGDYLDPRELLLFLPECVPESFRQCPHGELPPSPVPDALHTGTRLRMRGVISFDSYASLHHGRSSRFTTDHPTSHRSSPSYWEAWEGPSPYNIYGRDVSRAWRTAFKTFTLSPSRDTATKESGVEAVMAQEGPIASSETLRDVPQWGTSMTCAAFVARCWDALRAAVRASFTVLLQAGNFLVFPHRRAMEYATLVLSLQCGDGRLAYHIVSTGTALCLEDSQPLLRRAGEYRLLALLHFRCGDIQGSTALLQDSVHLSAKVAAVNCARATNAPDFFVESEGRIEAEAGVAVGAAASACFVAAQMVKWRRHWSKWEGHMTGRMVRTADPSPICGAALLHLPPAALSAIVMPSLLKAARLHESLPAVQRWALSSGEDPVVEEQRCHIVALYEQAATAPAGGCRLLVYEAVVPPSGAVPAAGVERLVAVPHTGTIYVEAPPFLRQWRSQPISNDGSTDDSASAPPALLPSSLTELFFLVEKLDVVGLQQLLRRHPRMAMLTDEEGSTALHHLMQVLTPPPINPFHGDASTTDALTAPKRLDTEPGSGVSMAKLLLILSLASLLVGHGCPLWAVSQWGLSCLDVAALCLEGVKEQENILSVILSSLVAVTEVNGVGG